MNDLEIEQTLNGIKKVETPPFLLTRINARIQAGVDLPKRWVYTSFALGAIILGFNVAVVQWEKASDMPLKTIEESMALKPSNQLYNE